MRTQGLFAAAPIAALATPGSAQSVAAGIEAWQRADYAGAVAIWRPLAEKGDTVAAFNLGQAYRRGRGVAQDAAAAQNWFERAARNGHVDAATMLGLSLFQSGNQTSGLRWLLQAAEKGEPRALLISGTALFNGDGMPRDPVRGYAYVSRAAAQGFEPARKTLAELDQILPLEQRKQALAMATAKATSSPKPRQVGAGATASAVATASPAKPGWRLQLGAFSTKGAAEALYRKLFAKDLIAATQAYYVPAGRMTRLQLGYYKTKADADAACRGMERQGQPCFPVRTP